MGDHADDLDHQMFMAMHPIDRASYRCGYCGERFGIYKSACQKHVNTCEKRLRIMEEES